MSDEEYQEHEFENESDNNNEEVANGDAIIQPPVGKSQSSQGQQDITVHDEEGNQPNADLQASNSEDESLEQTKNDLNLEEIDAVSEKGELIQSKNKATSKINSIKGNKPQSQQQQMVNQLIKKHKQKINQLQKKEDEIFIKEQVEKKQPKPARKPMVKQKLVPDKETKEQLENPKLSNQQKAVILTKDLGKKLEKKIVVNDPPKQIQIKQPDKNTEPKVKVNVFEIRIGAGIKGKLVQDTEELEEKQISNNTNILKAQKALAKEQLIQQLTEQKEMLKIKQKNLVKEQQKLLENKTKVLEQNTEARDNYSSATKAQQQQKEFEKSEDAKHEYKKDKEQLRIAQAENANLNSEIVKQTEIISELDSELLAWSKKDNVINVGGKYINIKKVKIKNTTDIANQMTTNSSRTMSQVSKVDDFGEPDIAQKVVNKIALNGLELKDAYALLDEDKDGVLTTKEIQNNVGRLNLNLSEKETKEFIQMLDKNSDGVLTEQEFIMYLTLGLQEQKEFIGIMGDIKDILNPIVLEERRLHIKYLQKYTINQIELETTKETQLMPKYKKLIQRLKKTEELVDSLKGTSSDKGKLRIQCEQLRNSLRQLQDIRNKVVTELRDKQDLINENVNTLSEELGQLAQAVLINKNKLRDQQVVTQKLQLKLVYFQQIRSKFHIEVQEKNVLEQSAAVKELNFQFTQQKDIQTTKDIEIQNIQYLHYVIIIQKFIRGQLHKKKFTNKVQKLKAGLLQVLQVSSKRNKQLKVLSVQRLKQYVIWFNQKQAEFKEKQLLLMMQEKKNQLEVKAMANKENKQKGNEDDYYLQILPKVIHLQKKYRYYTQSKPMLDQVYNVCYGPNNNDWCQICSSETAELICRRCTQTLYCDTCFKMSHKNHHKRNHEFYVVCKDELVAKIIQSQIGNTIQFQNNENEMGI